LNFVEEFKKMHSITDEKDSIIEFNDMDWLISSDHVMAIRVLDFDINHLIKHSMENCRIDEDSKGEFLEFEKESIEELKKMLEKDELVEYIEVKIPEKIESNFVYSINSEKKFGYSGFCITTLNKLFGRNKYRLFFPKLNLISYATCGIYIIIISPTYVYTGMNLKDIDISERTVECFDEDDLF
jgi:hypothetical protein